MDVNVNLSFLYVLVCFLIIFTIARKTLFTKLDKILNERHELIEGAREKAVGNDEYIEKTLADVNGKLSDARANAFSRRQELRETAIAEQTGIVENARKEAADKLIVAQEELDASLSEAKEQLKSETDKMAVEISDKILGGVA